MNNLKRVLSLALSGIMLVGMMAMGAGAADFTDAEEIQHDEAVNTLVALKVINGKDDGSFDPNGNVTRAEMAKMIAVAMNGGTDANTGVKGTPTFTDIDGHWAESYIEYCHDLGIISGRGDGTFDPGANVTGLEATKMVLTALGYDAEAYKLTGAKWSSRTDELARVADPSLYEDLAGVVMSIPATRDVAAQLIWNGLQNDTRRVTPSTNTNTGEVTWRYDTGDMMLYERYGARVWIGTYEGNSDSMTGLDAGFISIPGELADWTDKDGNSRVGTAQFASDMGIENIGEEVRVVFKDGNGGRDLIPDKKDTIYGVFNTGKTEVYKIIADDLQKDVTNEGKGKLKFDDILHEVAKGGITIEYNYDATTDTQPQSAGSTRATLSAMPAATEIKFVCNDDGKINAAYVTTFGINKVTGVTASKVTINGVGSISIDTNDIYEDVKKNDIVVYTKFYSADKDEAFFTVKKAEEVEGKLTGFKNDPDSTKYINIVLDGTTYNVNDPQTQLANINQDDAVTDLNDLGQSGGQASINDTIRLYMVGKFVGAVQSIETSGGKYAIVTEVSSGSQDSASSNMNPLKVTVMLPDGTKETLSVHRESTYAEASGSVTGKFKDLNAGSQQQGIFKGVAADAADLIEYTSISNGVIKIKAVMDVSGHTVVTKGSKLWNEDTKKLTFWDPSENNNSGGENSAVAANDAILFVGVDNAGYTDSTGVDVGDGTVDKFYTYDLRSLGDMVSTYTKYSGNGTVATGYPDGVAVSYFLDTKGLVKAAYITLNARPGSSTADTLYGIITKYVGSRVNKDGDDLYTYQVAVGRDEVVTVNVDTEKSSDIKAGDLVVFDERVDAEYVMGTDIKKLLSKDGTVASLGDGGAGMVLAAIREWNENAQLLTYYADTARASLTADFTGTLGSATVSKDVKIIYVNSDANKQGDEIGLNSFNPENGYANALLHTDKDGVVDVIIVETSGKANLASTAKDKNVINSAGKIFGAKTTQTVVGASKATHGTTKVNVTVSPVASATVEVGSTYTFTVKVDSEGVTETDIETGNIVIAVNNLSGVSVTGSGTNCSASVTNSTAGAEAVTIAVAAADLATSGTFTITGTVSGNISVSVS